ncbi:hypothetical protein DW352_05045 [Pseudolabrys taiwanensis]|uniref:Uncharacterized protein n=2 Tax=Pseudolabrys taiwanensis TaxID=331696 RepID=A0A345ZSP2_9HYPH|nr:hypothetical protein DW352_05045 [Pseudolabrys taiwanensis]
MRMSGIRLTVLAAVTLLGALLGATTIHAAAMRCSGEEQTCIAVCNKVAIKANLSACITTCGQRSAVCKRTGCWDNGTQQYCGLQRN